MTSVIGRGIVAGAVGTLLLNAATYADMLLTGRAASSAPGETALRALRSAGLEPPVDDHRVEAYGALGGMAAGVGVGVAASTARRLGVRVPAPVGAALIGAAAMVATDAPMAATGVTDLADWTATDWLRDIVPHLAFGIGVRWTLDAMTTDDEDDELKPASPGLVGRSLLLGLATGCRSTSGLLAPALSSGGGPAVVVTGALAVGELVADKLPQTPSRLELPGQVSRLVGGGVGAAALAAGEQSKPLLPVVAGLLGSAAGSVLGAAWREAAADRGWTWQAAVVEDAVALGLVGLAVRRT